MSRVKVDFEVDEKEWDTIPDLHKILLGTGITVVATAGASGIAALEAAIGAAALWLAGSTLAGMTAGTAAAAAAAGTATVFGPLIALRTARQMIDPTFKPKKNDDTGMLENAAWASFCATVGAVELGLHGTEVAYAAATAALGVPATMVFMGLAAAGCVLTVVGGAVVISGSAQLISSASNRMAGLFQSNTSPGKITGQKKETEKLNLPEAKKQ